MQSYKHISHPHPKLPKSISSKYVNIKITIKINNSWVSSGNADCCNKYKKTKKLSHSVCNSKKKLFVFSYNIELFLYLEKALHRCSTEKLAYKVL